MGESLGIKEILKKIKPWLSQAVKFFLIGFKKKLSRKNCQEKTIRKKLSGKNYQEKTVKKKLSGKNCQEKTKIQNASKVRSTQNFTT